MSSTGFSWIIELLSTVWGKLEKAMAPHSSPLAWRIPWTEEPDGLQSMGSWRVGHDWATSLSLFTFMHWRRKWQPTPVILPGESQGRGSLVGCRLRGRTESGTTEATQQQQQQYEVSTAVSPSLEINWGTKKLRNLSKAFQLASNGIRIQTQKVQLQNQCFFSTDTLFCIVPSSVSLENEGLSTFAPQEA